MYLIKKYTWFALAVFFFSPVFVQAQLTIQNGAVIKTTGNTIIALQDIDLVNNGSINQLAGDGGFVFTGSVNTVISGSSNPVFDKITMLKSGAARISLLQNININGSIVFSSGYIELNGHNILLQPTAFLSGEKESSRVTGNAGGYTEITNTLDAPVASNPGNLGAIITSTQNMGSTIVRRGHVSQKNAGGTGSSILRYYDIIPANNTALNATLRFSYFDAELNGLDENSLTLWTSSNGTNWTDLGFNSRDAAANYVEKNGVADLSVFTLSSVNNTLPVLFNSFTVQCVNEAAFITWTTVQEQNSNSFNIQKSLNGIQWQTIAVLPAAGNSSTAKNYSYTDANALAKTFYRVAGYDVNGSVVYTGLASSNCSMNGNMVSVYPNPVKDMLWISVNTSVGSALKINISDSKGALVRTQSTGLTNGNNKFSVNMQGLAAGVYYLAVQWNNGSITKMMKIVKQP
jgi:hypothetical protein